MRKVTILAAILAVAGLTCAGSARADSFTGNGNIVWTWSSSGSDGSGGFLVQLTVDASNPSASAGTSIFDTLSVQFFTDGTSATGVTLAGTSNNTSGWQYIGTGNVNQCGTGNLPFYCFQTSSGITITGGTNSGIYTFLFDVTGLNAPPTIGKVQALQGSLVGSNGNYAISQDISVPEPGSLALFAMGGLMFAPLLRRKRS